MNLFSYFRKNNEFKSKKEYRKTMMFANMYKMIESVLHLPIPISYEDENSKDDPSIFAEYLVDMHTGKRCLQSYESCNKRKDLLVIGRYNEFHHFFAHPYERLITIYTLTWKCSRFMQTNDINCFQTYDKNEPPYYSWFEASKAKILRQKTYTVPQAETFLVQYISKALSPIK